MKYGHYSKFEKVLLTASTIAEWMKTSEYSGTMPSGVIPGKKWRRHDGCFDPTCDDPGWLLCEYSEAFIGDDGHERCKILMKRAVIRVPAISDRMFVINAKDMERAIRPVPTAARKDGERGVRYAPELIDFCEQTFGYLPERLVEARLMPLAPRAPNARFILKFKSAKDVLVFKMWFE